MDDVVPVRCVVCCFVSAGVVVSSPPPTCSVYCMEQELQNIGSRTESLSGRSVEIEGFGKKCASKVGFEFTSIGACYNGDLSKKVRPLIPLCAGCSHCLWSLFSAPKTHTRSLSAWPPPKPTRCSRRTSVRTVVQRSTCVTLGLDFHFPTPQHTDTPWVTVNGKPVYNAVNHFATRVCQEYTGPKPAACSDPPVDDDN